MQNCKELRYKEVCSIRMIRNHEMYCTRLLTDNIRQNGGDPNYQKANVG